MAPQAEAKRVAVLGWPVSHSLSPRLHNYWLKLYGLEENYEAIAVKPEDLKLFLMGLPAQGFAGVNLTIPHKEKAFSLLDETDAIAKRIGAVNTVVVKDGRLIGTNTDAYGFIANIQTEMKNVPAGETLVLGAGGAARAVCVGLLDAGWKVIIANRTYAKAEALQAYLQSDHATSVHWDEINSAMEKVSLLVNTTSLGMKGEPPLELSLEALQKNTWVNDIVYAPQPSKATQRFSDPTFTDLLARAAERGNPVITGLGMLLYQAQPAFEAWFGVRPEITDALHRYMQVALA